MRIKGNETPNTVKEFVMTSDDINGVSEENVFSLANVISSKEY